jgi:hypothetical protein
MKNLELAQTLVTTLRRQAASMRNVLKIVPATVERKLTMGNISI